MNITLAINGFGNMRRLPMLYMLFMFLDIKFLQSINTSVCIRHWSVNWRTFFVLFVCFLCFMLWRWVGVWWNKVKSVFVKCGKWLREKISNVKSTNHEACWFMINVFYSRFSILNPYFLFFKIYFMQCEKFIQ